MATNNIVQNADYVRGLIYARNVAHSHGRYSSDYIGCDLPEDIVAHNHACWAIRDAIDGAIAAARLTSESEARAQAEATSAERDRRAACFDDLLEALAVMTGLVRLKYGNLDADVWGEVAKAEEAIAKARGPE